MKLTLIFLLLLPTMSHAMFYFARQNIFETYLSMIPSQIDITAEMKLYENNTLKEIARYLYLKKNDGVLETVPGGILAGRQTTERYNLAITYKGIDYEKDQALFKYQISSPDESIIAEYTQPIDLHKSKTIIMQTKIKNENNTPVFLTIQSKITR